jgi:uncharacterized protein
MRRKEFEITNQSEIAGFLNQQRSGILSLVDENRMPYSIPLNYVYSENNIYLHSSLQGRKAGMLKKSPCVQFTVYREYSFIPSYFLDKPGACGASQFFKSVMLSGKAEFINSPELKSRVLNCMMQSHQPEGRYEALDPHSRAYSGDLAMTGIIEIKPLEITAKFKFGQQLDEDKISNIIRHLKERNSPLDRETLLMIEKYRKQ